MTIVAQLSSLSDAYACMDTLRSRAIPPRFSKSNDGILISVDDDFAPSARQILSGDSRFSIFSSDANSYPLQPGFEECNA